LEYSRAFLFAVQCFLNGVDLPFDSPDAMEELLFVFGDMRHALLSPWV
jgi:hypothetical protein